MNIIIHWKECLLYEHTSCLFSSSYCCSMILCLLCSSCILCFYCVFHMITTCFASTYLHVIITLNISMFFMWHSSICFSPNFYVLDFMFCIGFYNFLLNFCFYQFMIMLCTYVLHSYILVFVLFVLYVLPTSFPHLLARTYYG